MLERAFDCAQEVKSRQMALTAKQGQREGETEAAFFADILFQRDQVRPGQDPTICDVVVSILEGDT